MTNPLSPQLRADKNGKMVTRHVKAGITTSSSSSKVPAPSIAAHLFRIPDRDVMHSRKAATTKQGIEEAKRIRGFFGIPPIRESLSPLKMSDNEILDYMQEGFTATAAVEFKRWGITPDVAIMSTLPRQNVKKTVARMRALDLTPEEATKIIRHGMNDRLLDVHLNDNELFGLLHEERLESPTYPERSKGVHNLVMGVCTREDAKELDLEQLGKYGGYLRVEREAGREIDYSTFRKLIERIEGPNRAVPQQRYHEGWQVNEYKFNFHALKSLVKTMGTEVLELEHLGVLRMGFRYGEDIEAYKFIDKFFSLTERTSLRTTEEQRRDMKEWDNSSYSVADFVDGLRLAGLTPEQAYHSLTNGLTLDKAKEVHLNKQATAMIDGWL